MSTAGESEEKERQYGELIPSMEKASRIANEISCREFTADDIYVAMIALKMSRMSQSYKYDTYLDAIGYIAARNEYLKQLK